LSSRPENIRGLQGKVVIDEAAFHPNVQGVMEAATALLIWGGRISVISSHNGKQSIQPVC
jgi:phage FluMu gp28-like protein